LAGGLGLVLADGLAWVLGVGLDSVSDVAWARVWLEGHQVQVDGLVYVWGLALAMGRALVSATLSEVELDVVLVWELAVELLALWLATELVVQLLVLVLEGGMAGALGLVLGLGLGEL
jgi:hypothetical protein